MKAVKLKYTHQELHHINAIWEVDIRWDQTSDQHKMCKSIIDEVSIKYLKKALERKKSYSITLKPHEAVAMKIYIGAVMGSFLEDIRSFNQLQMQFNLLHQKTI